MIYKIVGSYFFLCLCIAVFLSINGVSSTTQLGSYLQGAMVEINRRMSYYTFKIPNIPSIPLEWAIDQNSVWDAIPVVRLAKTLTIILNFIIKILNGVSWVLNIVIKLFEFVVVVFEVLDTMSAQIVYYSRINSNEIMYLMCSW